MMSHRFPPPRAVLSAAIAVVWLAPVALAGQSRKAAPTTTKTWTPPRTPDGQPDLEGMWTNPTITPFERPG